MRHVPQMLLKTTPPAPYFCNHADESKKRHFYAVLGMPSINSAVGAVSAVIAAAHRGGRHG